MLLEKILEEDSSFADESRRSESIHSDKRHLLASNGGSPHHNHHSTHAHQQDHHTHHSVHVTNI
jgi:hypothetical protein